MPEVGRCHGCRPTVPRGGGWQRRALSGGRRAWRAAPGTERGPAGTATSAGTDTRCIGCRLLNRRTAAGQKSERGKNSVIWINRNMYFIRFPFLWRNKFSWTWWAPCLMTTRTISS